MNSVGINRQKSRHLPRGGDDVYVGHGRVRQRRGGPSTITYIHTYIHVLMRDEKEGKKKEASKVKQTNKAKQHSTPKAVTCPKKMSCLRWDSKKERSKQGQTNKQGKATQHTQGSHLSKKNELPQVGLELTTL